MSGCVPLNQENKITMKIEEIKDCLQAGGFQVASETPLANATGIQLRLQNGAIANSFHTGNVNIQSKNRGAVEECLGIQSAQSVTTRLSQNGTPAKQILSEVFVVYGHDAAARNELEVMPRRW